CMSGFEQPIGPFKEGEPITNSQAPSATPDEPLHETMSVAGVVWRNGTGLMAHRPASSQSELANKWEFVGGKVANNEGPAVALRREFMEELGVSIHVGPLFYRGSFQHKDTHFTLQAFLVHLQSEEFTLTEHDEVRWLTVDEMVGLDMASSDYGIVEYLMYHPDGPAVRQDAPAFK
ncbi:MAG: (deoxy)nucleoside triphosphate pyrophosphohydrolase, partial [Spirochaetota bacterium]